MKTTQERMNSIREKAAVRQAEIKKQRTQFTMAAIAVSLTLIIALGVLAPMLKNGKPPVTPDNTTEGITETPISTDIPDWYKPGELNVTALLSRSAKSASDSTAKEMSLASKNILNKALAIQAPSALNSGIYRALTKNSKAKTGDMSSAYTELPESMVAAENSEFRDIDYLELESASEYPNGKGIYYYVPQGKVICFSSIIEEKAAERGVLQGGDEIQFYYNDPLTGNSVFCLGQPGEENRGPYFCNIYDGRFMSFPIKVYSDWQFEKIGGENRKYYATLDTKGALFLVDMSSEKLDMLEISKTAESDLHAHSRIGFSENGRYCYYTYMKDGISYDEDNVPNVAIYDIKNKTTTCIKGSVERFVDGDKVIVVTKDGGAVLDCASGRDVTAETELEEWQKYTVRISYLSYSFYGKTIPSLVPLFSNENEKILAQDVGAVLAVDEYVYIYMPGEDHIICRQVAGEESFAISLDEAFVNEIKSVNTEEMSINYYMTISPDKSKLLLFSGIYPGKEQRGGFSPEEIGMLFRSAASLADLKDFVENAKNFKPDTRYWSYQKEMYKEYGNLCVVEGDGYTSLIVFGNSYPNALIAVEDYRDGMFSLYTSYGKGNSTPWAVPPALYNGALENQIQIIGTKPYRKTLASGANQADTLELLRGIKKIEPYYDYADFYTDGKLDSTKLADYYLMDDVVNTATSICLEDFSAVEKIESGEIHYQGIVNDRQTLSEILHKVADIDEYFSYQLGEQQGMPSNNNYSNETGELLYRFQFLDAEYPYIQGAQLLSELEIGRLYEGKYFIRTPAGYAYISAELYDELIDTCAALYSEAEIR